MTMGILVTTAGSKLHIGSAPMAFTGTDKVLASFSGVDWIEIKGHTELVSSNQIGISRTRKAKGTRNAGAKTIIMDFDPADPGQIALLAAEKESYSYPFRIILNDAPAGGTPSERYFIAFVMSHEEQLGEANNAVKLVVVLEIDSNIVRVAATDDGAAPDNTILPVITGTAEEGQTLTVAPGTWTGTPTPTFSYQWFSAGESIPGATATTYEIQASDVGNTITVLETATNSLGSAQAMSLPTATVTSD
jgi:hypothetical protein